MTSTQDSATITSETKKMINKTYTLTVDGILEGQYATSALAIKRALKSFIGHQVVITPIISSVITLNNVIIGVK